MNLLAIDTSSEKATVALSVNGQITSDEQREARQHAQYLLPMVERLLTQSKCSLAQLDGIVFGQGPGSFTGLRIACSVVKALAYAHDLPVYPVSSLAAIAYEANQVAKAKHDNYTILAVIDARMKQLYSGEYAKDSFDTEPLVCDAANICLSSTSPIILAGIGFEDYLDDLPESITERIIDKLTIAPNAAAMINLVQLGLIKAVKAVDALPVYVRNQVTHGEPRG